MEQQQALLMSGGESQLLQNTAALLQKAGLQVTCVPNVIKSFADGETVATLPISVRGKRVFVFHDYLVGAQATWQAAQIGRAIRKSGGKKPFLVMPLFPFSRQDVRKERTCDSAAMVVHLLEANGYKGIMTVDLHAKQERDMGDHILFDDLSARKLFADFSLERQLIEVGNTVVVNPDDGARKNNCLFAEHLGLPMQNMPKDRAPLREKLDQIHRKEDTLTDDDVKGKVVLMLDDIASSCSTAASAMAKLREHGAKKIILFISHAVLVGDYRNLLQSSQPDLLVTTNSTGRAELLDGICPYVELDLSMLLAPALKALMTDGSISPFLAETN